MFHARGQRLIKDHEHGSTTVVCASADVCLPVCKQLRITRPTDILLLTFSRLPPVLLNCGVFRGLTPGRCVTRVFNGAKLRIVCLCYSSLSRGVYLLDTRSRFHDESNSHSMKVYKMEQVWLVYHRFIKHVSSEKIVASYRRYHTVTLLCATQTTRTEYGKQNNGMK